MVGHEGLSHGQRSLWFLHHLAPVGGAYNIAAAMRLLSPVDAGALERAFQALVDRHDALRTTFPAVAGEPCRRVAAELRFALVCEDATGWSEEQLRARLAEEAWRPFDLEHGPLLRVTLFTGGSTGPVLLLVIHHIIADFWSLAILMRELPALLRGPSDLPPPDLYGEHVRREREALAGPRGEELLAWWRERLAGLPVLEMPTDRPRPAVQTYRGDGLRLRLPGELTTAVRACARAQHGTLFMGLAAAVQALLARHTGQEDLALGTPRAGRSPSAFAGTVGYFVNPVVLRGDLSGDPTFAGLLERTREAVHAAFAHGDIPLPLLAEHLQVDRDASRTPLFQVSFALQKETRGAEGLTAFALGEDGVEIGPESFRLRSLAVPRQPAPFDLVLHAVERQGGLSLALQYNVDLFDAATAVRLLDHFVRLLSGAVAAPERRLSELPLLSEAERAELLVEWNDTAAIRETASLVHELILEQARRQPEALAVAAPDARLTYGELAERAGRLAALLRRHGVRPEVRVALCAGPAAGRVVGSLAVLAAGGACVLLDPEAPPERLRFLVADAEAAVVLTEGALAECFAACRARVVDLADAGRDEALVPASEAGPENLAYVVYTSGSTGLPKGVAVSHAGLRNLVSWHLARYGTGPADRATLIANPAFDASVWELWPHLAAGASLHIPPAETRLAPREIVRFWRSAGITWSFLPTPLAEAVLAEEDLAGLALRGLLCGGDRLRQAPPPGLPFALVNHYGPSEVSVVSTAAAVLPESPGAPPIGRPVHNLRTFVADPWGGLAPRGAVGELWLGGVGGVGLARGYLARPGLTAERFVPDPWSGAAGERLYRTGDLVRHRLDGNLEFLGRIDHQIKLRGYRIELGEIEAALRLHPAVGEAAVAFLAHEERLVAYVVAAAGEAPPGRELRELLRARLPGYMVPAVYVPLPALPRTPSGKLDRKALPAPTREAADGSVEMPPRTPAEELMAGIFAEVLGAGRVGVDDGFFERGGHSLAATRLVARVREAFGVDLPLSRVFETPTVAELARAVERTTRSDGGPPLVAVPRDQPLPLSFAQQRLWFLHQLEPASPAYNIPARVQLTGRLGRRALAAALAEVVRRHEALRTSFREVAGEPVQIIAGRADFALPLIDLQDREEVDRLAAAEARRPFDLQDGPLLRALLLRLGDEEHVLLLTMHHIVSDGWSMGVMVRELGSLYAAFAAGRPSLLPELAIQYADFAVWQRRYLTGEALDAELAWWREQLADMPPALELPTDHPRPADRSTRGAVHAFTLEGEGPTAFSRRQGATLFMVLLAGFAGLLQRFTGAEDLVVGTPIAGRTRVETEPLIGFFVNTLALRLGLAGSPSFRDLLERLRETTLAAYAHQDVPFERLVEELAPERDRSRPPLVQVLLALQNTPAALVLPGLELTAAPQATGTAKLELSCVLTASERGLAGTLEYNRDLFDHTTAVRLAAGLERLLEAAVDAPETRVTDLPVLSPVERAALVFEWNDTAAPPREPLVHELFAEQARRQPDALAIAAGGERLSYGELAARAGKLARLLGRLGVGPETRVALCAGATVHRVVGSLAVLLAGGASVLMDPEAPPERLAYLVADSGAAAVLTERSLAGRFGSCAVPLVELESGEGEPAGSWPVPAAGPQSLAYVVYTSGSTGLPKGVAVSHGGLLNLVSWHRAAYGLLPVDRATLIANPAFDAAVWELWPYLAAGASVHIPDGETRFSPPAIVRFWRSAGITWSFLPTPLAEEVITQGAASLAGLSLKGLLCGGDRLHHGPGPDVPFALINHYGPSEVSVVSTFAAVPPGTVGTPPIGRPIHQVRAFVADARGALVPRGAAGELWIGGASLARGYLGRPALTAERFVPDPWSGEPGGRLYRTGDLVRHRPGGSLEFLGRIDHQIKLRGFRIEPGEIEAALRGHPAVSEAAVTVHAQRLVAHVVGAGERAPSGGELRDFLRQRLPGPLVPSSYVALAALPLTPNGKVDRKALAQMPLEREAERAGAAPQTPAEELVAGIFAEVLGVERVGPADNFFELGGHSLLATRVASRVRSVFGTELPVRVVFEEPTVAGLAGWLDRAGHAREAADIGRVSREEPLVLSFAQQRLWFFDQMEGGSLYSMSMALQMSGPLSVAVLARVFAEVVRRHEVLRTVFSSAEGRARQVVLPPSGFAVPVVDLAGLSPALREPAAMGLALEEARRPFDLARGPLLRARLWRLDETEHLLLFAMHHIVSDGWSLGVLVREVTALYAAFSLGAPSPLAELPVQYADFAAWQRNWLSGEVLARELEHWRRHLAGAPPVLELPADRPHPAVRSFRGASRAGRLAPDLTQKILSLARRQGATLFMTLAAGFQGWLARITGQTGFTLGTPVAGRNRLETEGLIGFFVNTLVLRADLQGDPSFGEILRRVRGEALEAYQHQDLPFERLVEELAPERSLQSSPLFQVMLAQQNTSMEHLEMPGVELRPVAVPTVSTDFDLTLVLREAGQGLETALDYSTDLFDGATVARCLAQLERLLEAAAEAPEMRLSQLPLLGAGERFQVVAEWNDTGGDADEGDAEGDGLLHELFLAQAARAPDRVAVTCGPEHLTYGELAAESARVARELVARGLRAEIPAGILLERGIERIVALLGVLRAGTLYLPLDPALPPERLGELLAGSGTSLVVTREGLLPRLPAGLAPRALCLNRLERTARPQRWVEALAAPGQAAYVLYTSGSTGRPKGVVVAHRAAAWYARCAAANFALAPSDCALQFASLSFDVSIEEIFPVLAVGGRLVIFPAGDVPAAGAFLAVCRAAEVTVLTLATAYWHELVIELEARPEALPPALRLVSIGGEKARPDRVASWQRLAPGSTVYNGYGPTETTVIATLYRLGDEPWDVTADLPLGRPLRGARAYILDRRLEPLPPGVPGELAIGGAGLARGYLGEPAMTAERFVPDPFGAAGGRLYRTGDLARQRPDGMFEFLGRIDHQVKLRGFRIEPGEIEQALASQEDVTEAVVVLREDLPGGRGLVAYAARKPGADPSAAALREGLKSKLPPYMVPAHVVLLDALPLTSGSKLDRRWLAEHGPLPGVPAGRASRALTPAEELLAGLFAELLGMDGVAEDADFFELGGHSLLATRLVSRVRATFGIELPLRAVFEHPAIAGLAREIEKASRSGGSAAVARVERMPRNEGLPLSFTQERLWFLQQLEPGSAAYNMPLELELSGALRTDALAAALAGVLDRHEALRTTFVSIAGELCQRIAPPEPVAALPLVDLSALPAAARDAAAGRLAQWHAGQGFDLERGPLCAWLLVRLDGERHRFLLNLHHTIADGWSIQVLARELGELYAASLEGRPGRLPELPVQYADFAIWQRRWLAEKQDEELAYWESRLGGDVASAELPTDRPRPAIQTFRGGRCRRVLSEDLTARLRRFGRAEGVTLFMTLLAATQALLARHSGENDVTVGVPVAGRQWAETEGLIGCFLNTLVLRTDASGRPGFRALADRVRKATLDAWSHQNVPFEAVLRRLGLRRDLSRNPLFQVLFNLLNLPPAELSLPGVELRALIPAEVPSKLDLTFYVSEDDGGIGIDLVYNADLFDEARIEDLLAQLELFLDAALERPEAPVTELPLLTPAMRQVFPDPTLELDRSWIGSVYELFAAQAERAPERAAVADAAGVQTYGGLLAGSRRVAGWLAAQGVRPEDPVAILAVRAAPLVEAVLGVLGAGAAFVMLDAAYPPLRQLEMLRLASPRAWISFGGEEGAVPAEVRSWLREAGCPCLELPPGGSGAVPELAAFACEAPEVRAGPDDVAGLGFTSGSTGGPKGILARHGPLSHFLPAHCRMFELGPDDRFSLLSGLGHDPLQREIFTPLYLGGTIAVPSSSDYGISGRLAAWLCREQVTVSHLTPTLGQLLTEMPSDGTREPVASLRRVLLVGESLTRNDVVRLRALAPEVSCINLYGSTETQRAVAFHRVAPEEAEAALSDRTERAQQVLPLGRGVPDVQLLVLNPAGGLAGLGEVGEIAVRSPHLAAGYLGNLELTAEKFQANPFTGDPDDRIYRTGDLGRYRADGEVVFAGRLDQQVKLRGFRIELGEIEGVLAALPGVLEAAVLLRPDLPGGAGLVAYVRTAEGREAALRGELEARLPAYMVPAAFVRLDQLPRNANGKLDRRALLQILPELGATAVRTLPRTPAEEILAGIWSQVLGVEQIGAGQSFFELGGHSLLAAQMASRVRDVFGVELPLRSLFVTPALAGLAAEIERLRSGALERPTIASFRQDRSAPPPLSFAQERYWAGRHLEARSVAATLPMLLHLAGPLDRAALRQALAAVVERHEILRTSFREEPEGPVQVIHPAVPVALPEVDLERLGAAERMAEVRRFSVLDGRLHFDYERPPLFRPTLFRCAAEAAEEAEEHILLFTIHHVASDWWSSSVLIREMAALYLAFRSGQPSPLPPLPAQFQDFARWQRRLSSGDAHASQVTFWREHLSGAFPIDLGAGRPRSQQRTFTAGTVEIEVPEELERQLDAFSARQGVTLFMTLLAAFKALLQAETGWDDLVVPCSFANRNQLETESLIGNLATGLPLRTRLSGVRTFRELLERVRDVTLLAHDHPDIFWEPVVEGMSFLEEGDRGGLTTFRILFQLIKAPPVAQAASELRMTQLPVDTGRIRLDLSLFLSQSDRLAGRFRYNRDVLDAERVRALRDRFLQILAAAVAGPERPLAELALAAPVPQEVDLRHLAILSVPGC